MWMFLVAVDNKTDIATMMYIELWIIFILMALLKFNKFKNNKAINTKSENNILVEEKNNSNENNWTKNIEKLVFDEDWTNKEAKDNDIKQDDN